MANVGLYRSQLSNLIAGVMGGIAERFCWNVTLLRIIFILISVMSAAFPGLLVYLILWLIMPKRQNQFHNGYYQNPIRNVNQKDHSSF